MTRYSADLTFVGNNKIEKQPTEAKTKRVALTFDDGPHYQYTWLITDKLIEYGARATFFVVGNRCNGSASAAVNYAYKNGCEIGVHGYTHQYKYDVCTDEIYNSELSKTADKIYSMTGKYPTLMRPIGGRITDARTKACKYAVIKWSVDSNDWRYKAHSTDSQRKSNIKTIVNNVKNAKVKDGDIILMHEIYGNSYEAFCTIIKTLSEQGFEFVTVSEICSAKPGTLYTKGK